MNSTLKYQDTVQLGENHGKINRLQPCQIFILKLNTEKYLFSV